MIRFLIDLYIIILVADAILSFFPDLRKHTWAQTLKKVADFTCKPVRKYLPQGLGIDISPFVVIAFLKVITFIW